MAITTAHMPRARAAMRAAKFVPAACGQAFSSVANHAVADPVGSRCCMR
jgi:hypothetical protein